MFADGKPVLMTEKDAVKCKHLADARHWYVPVGAYFDADESTTLLGIVTQSIAKRRQPPRGSYRWINACSSYWSARCARVRLSTAGSGSTLELICRPDRLAYAVRDGIPLMLPEEARVLSADDPVLNR